MDNMECISCNECVNVCPARDTLSITGPKNAPGLPGRVVQELLVATQSADSRLTFSASVLDARFLMETPGRMRKR